MKLTKRILQGLIFLVIPSLSQAAIFNLDLYSPSGKTVNTRYDLTFTAYTGTITIEAPTILDPFGGYNQFTFSFDNVVPSDGLSILTFDITTADFLSGSGTYFKTYEEIQDEFGNTLYPETTTGGNMITTATGCIECNIVHNFNTSIFEVTDLGWGYELTGGVLPISANPLLTSHETSGYFDIDEYKEFHITSVPIPGGLWLFSSGLLVLLNLNQRKPNHC